VADGAEPALPRGGAVRRRARLAARLKGDTLLRRAEEQPEDTLGDKADARDDLELRDAALAAHLDRILERERDIAAVIVFTVPMAHLRGIPTHLRERYGVPVVFYDGDVPMSLPEFGGMDTGFNYYHGADPSSTTSSSRTPRAASSGCASSARAERRRSSGRPTPSCSSRRRSRRSYDVFFYGYGDKFRREWMQALIGEPSRADVRDRLRARREGLPRRRRQCAPDR
jgi:hypothetical protein